MLYKNSSNSFHICLFDKYVTRKLQQEEILSVLKKFFFLSENELKFCDVRLLLLEIDETGCIKK